MTNLRIGLVSDFFRGGVGEGAAAYGRAHGMEIDPRGSVRGDWMRIPSDWDGIIAEVVGTGGLEERLLESQLPIVLLSPLSTAPLGTPVVMPDFRACGALAFGELAACGAKHLVVLRGTPGELDEESCAGFIEAATAQGRRVIDPEPARKLAATSMPLSERVRACADLLQEVPRPAGIYLPQASLAYSLITELHARGFRIPADFSLVVLRKDGRGTAEMAPVPITTVDPDNWQQGYFAARLLHRQLTGEPAAALHRIPPLGLTRRDSTSHPVGADPVVAKVLHLIRERFATELKIDELARLAGVGRRSLEERFRKEMRISVHEALTHRRIDEAKRLLRSTPLAVGLVAEACGYSSVHYFSTAFKRETSTSPAAYRTVQAAHPPNKDA